MRPLDGRMEICGSSRVERIPFNRPYLVGKELFYISQAVLSGKLSGDGEFTKRCHSFLERRYAAQKVLLTTSCTTALEIAAILCRHEPGDEVIVPGFTFVSTANAFVTHGYTPVFVDIREDTLNMDERLLEEAITDRTRVICPVHYAGVACDMDPILRIARSRGIAVVEDAAQGVEAKYKDRALGTIGDLGAYSFHDTKNFVCGEGGALLVNREDFVERTEIIREKGTNRTQFFRGEAAKYTWLDVGGSYLPSEVLSAFLLAQLEAIDQIQARRAAIFNRYTAGLKPLQDQALIRLPYVPAYASGNNHIFYVLTETPDVRDNLLVFLRERGISAVFHYVPLHNSPAGLRWGRSSGTLKVVERTAATLLRLPMFLEITDEQIDRVVSAVHEFFRR